MLQQQMQKLQKLRNELNTSAANASKLNTSNVSSTILASKDSTTLMATATYLVPAIDVNVIDTSHSSIATISTKTRAFNSYSSTG